MLYTVYIVKLYVVQLVAGGSSKVRADLFPVNYIFSCHKDGVGKTASPSVLFIIFLYFLLKREKLMGSFTKYLHRDPMLEEISHLIHTIARQKQ